MNNQNQMNKTLLSKDEMSKAINKLTQFLDVDEEEEDDDLPEYLRQKNDQADYVDEPLVIENLRDIAKEIAEMASQNEELTKKIMKHQKSKTRKIHSYDLRIKRLYECSQNQQNKRAELQFERFQSDIKNLTWTPAISNYSRKLAEKKTNNVPIHLRVDQYTKNKQIKIESLRAQLEYEKAIKNDDCQINLEQKKFEKEIGENVTQNWNKIKNWYEKKNEYIMKGQFKKLEREVEELTLKPKINKKSEELLKETTKEPVEDRLIKKYIEKMEKKKKKSELKDSNNTPYISKRSKKLAERHYQKEQENRLETNGIEYLPKHEFILDSLGKFNK